MTDTAAPKKARRTKPAIVEAPPLAPTLPADLDAMDAQVAADDEAAAVALLRGRKARREMVDEIAMLRRQVETLTATNGDLVSGLKAFEEGYKSGEPKFVPLFALIPKASDQGKALKTEREKFYAARMAKDAATPKAPPAETPSTPDERRIASELEGALADEFANDAPPPFLLGKATHPLEKPQTETIGQQVRVAAAVAVAFIAAFRIFA